MMTLKLSRRPAPRIRALHGVNLAAPMNNAKVSQRVTEYLRPLQIPLTRMHDAPLDNPGLHLVDIPCVFPNRNADPARPENYYFDQTDDYFANAWEYGTEIMYRLGTSIELGPKHYWTKPPADPDQWAEICLHIMAHYPRIEYWEIWNEADTELALLWDGTWQQYIDFYCRVATRLKAKFPGKKIGGPSLSSMKSGDGKYVRDFLGACRERNAPLDFFSYHQYSDKPEKIIDSPVQVRQLLDSFGFPGTEIHLAEWHYHPGWGSDCDAARESAVFAMMLGIDAAAYLCSVLAGWQTTPLTMGEYYTGSTGRGYALFDQYGERTPGYYAMEFFNRLVQMPEGIAVESSDPDTRLLGAASDRKLLALASSFKTVQDEVTFQLPGRCLTPENTKLYVLDFGGVPRHLQRELRWTEDSLTFEKVTGSAVFLLEHDF